ncbi:MAG: alpha-amylase, partial [Euryarchaeota archaeon CG_4_9_14_3_um_filter_38_12]
MKLCFYFQVHQPTRLNKLSILDFCKNGDLKQMYFNERKNREILLRVAEKCYLPTNRLMIGLINKYDIKFALSLSGVFIEQCQEYAPAVLDSFNALAETGNVEFIDETYYHSLASLHKDKNEFIEQIKEHAKIIKRLFNQKPTAFRNTELIYSNEIAGVAESLGYKTILAEGINLGWRSPNYVYRPRGCSKIKLLLRNYMLSDDVSFRFSAHAWSGYPLTADKYASWLSHCTGDVINIFMDYETFGEHQWKETGIFEFLRHLPAEIKKYNLEFATPEEIEMEPAGEYDAPNVTSWAD